MEVVVRLKDEEVLKLPYQLISETTHRSVWNTGRRIRKMDSEFTKEERREIATIIQMSRRWASSGAPQEVIMSSTTAMLWKRLANFCYGL